MIADWYAEMRKKVDKDNAISLTIEKCQKAAAGEIPLCITGEDNCPLCLAYPDAEGRKGECISCPLFKRTKQVCDMTNPGYATLRDLWLHDVDDDGLIRPGSDTARYLKKKVIPLLKTLRGEDSVPGNA